MPRTYGLTDALLRAETRPYHRFGSDMCLAALYMANLWTPWYKPITVLFLGIFTYIYPTIPDQVTAQGIVILVAMDTVTGVAAAIRTKTKLSSHRFGRVLLKFFGYSMMVGTVAVVFNSIASFQVVEPFAVSTVTKAILLTEGISILENLKKLKLSTHIPDWLSKLMRGK